MKSEIQIKLEWLTDWFWFFPQSTCEHMSRPLVVISNNAGLWDFCTSLQLATCPSFIYSLGSVQLDFVGKKPAKVLLSEQRDPDPELLLLYVQVCVSSPSACFYSAQLLAFLLVALLYKLDFTEKLLLKCRESLIVKVCAGWRPNAERINKMDRR